MATVQAHALQCVLCALTVWLRVCRVAGGDYTEQKLILGTHTSAGEDNYLMIADVLLPSESAVLDASKYDEEKGGTLCASEQARASCMKAHIWLRLRAHTLHHNCAHA